MDAKSVRVLAVSSSLEEWDFGKDYVQEKEWKIMWHDSQRRPSNVIKDQGRPHFVLDNMYNFIGTVGGYLGLFIGFSYYAMQQVFLPKW